MCPEQMNGNTREKAAEDLTLCFLISPQDASRAFLGALMLTDYRARPLHFAFASPVRPTPMQRILYGTTLDDHVRVDVIASTLLKGVPRVPDVVFVDTPELLSVRRVTGVPTAVLTKSAVGETSNPGSNLSTLRYDTGSMATDQDIVGHILAKLELTVDLVEPFARMTSALKEAVKSQTT